MHCKFDRSQHCLYSCLNSFLTALTKSPKCPVAFSSASRVLIAGKSGLHEVTAKQGQTDKIIFLFTDRVACLAKMIFRKYLLSSMPSVRCMHYVVVVDKSAYRHTADFAEDISLLYTPYCGH